MAVLGSVSLEVGLDFSTLDQQIQSLDGRKLKPIKLQLDSQDLSKQIKGLDIPSLPVPLALDLENFQSQIKGLVDQIDPIKVDLSPNVGDFQKKLNRAAKTLDAIPVSFSLGIEGLQSELKKLPNQIDPIKVDLSPNVGDFQEKLRRVGRISQVNIDVNTDGLKSQFETIGVQARQGFLQGFTSQSIGQAAGDSITKSVKENLEIQSPSKVFQEIGENAIQGFLKGLVSGESGIKTATNQIEGIFNNLNLKTKFKLQFDAEIGVKKNREAAQESGITNAIREGFKTSGRPDDITKSIEKGFKKVEPHNNFLGSLISAPFKQAFEGIFLGAGLPLGEEIGHGLSAQLQSIFKFNAREVGSGTADKIAAPIKFFTENEELQEQLKKISADFGEKLKKAGYRIGEGIVGALESDEETIEGKLNAFTKIVFDFKPGELEATIKKLGEEIQAAFKGVGESLINENTLRGITEPYGKWLSQHREETLKEKAIPLVQKRAGQILNQKKTKNSAKLVNEDTEELFIATGGYAGARGLSGDRLAKNLKKQIGPNQEAIWVRNEDTDIPKASLGDASKKLQALLTSITKPILRGFSKDAIEIASQALAAIEINPKIRIKILGESGGGFAAEEAAKILELMGVKNVDFVGVGTPEFIGGLDDKGRKIISPDETLGAESASFYSRLGLSHADKSSQQIMGVHGHPYEHYQEANIAELQNFIHGAPTPFTSENISEAKEVADAFKSQDLSKLDSRQLQDIAKMAYANLQNIRRQILIATDDTKKELEEIAQAFEQVYIRSSPENSEISEVRATLTQAQKIYNALDEQRGIEAGQVAQELLGELREHYKQFQVKFKNTVGTTKEKVAELNKMFVDLIELLSDPSIGVRGSERGASKIAIEPPSGVPELIPAPVTSEIPEPVTPELVPAREDLDPIIQPYRQSEIAGNLDNELQRLTNSANQIIQDIELARDSSLAEIQQVAIKLNETIESVRNAFDAVQIFNKNINETIASSLSNLKIQPSTVNESEPVIRNTQISANEKIPEINAAEKELVNPSPKNIPKAANEKIPAPEIDAQRLASLENKISLAEKFYGKEISSATARELGIEGLKGGDRVTHPILKKIKDERDKLRTEIEKAKSPIFGTDEAIINSPQGPGFSLGTDASKQDYQSYVAKFKEGIASSIKELPGLDISHEISKVKQLIEAISLEERKLAEESAKQQTADINRILGQYGRRLREIREELSGRIEGIQPQVNIEGRFGELKSQIEKDGQGIGANLAKGIGKGIESEKILPIAEIQQLIGETEQAAKRSAQIESPSRIFAEIGRFIVEGIAVGIEKSSSVPAEEIQQVVEVIDIAARREAGINSAAKNFFPIGEYIVEGVAAGIEKGKPLVETAIGGTIEAIESVANAETAVDVGINLFSAIGGGLENIKKQAYEAVPALELVEKGASALLGGFFAYQGIFLAQDFFRQISAGAYDAYIELDRFKTALDFASGGSGTQGLNFVRKEVEDLKIPIRGAIEGYSQLTAATRNTPLEGKEAEQLSYALNEASTVLSLSSDNTKEISDTISKAISRGKIGAEVLDELGTRIPGAQGIAARSLGVSEPEFARLSESGEINATDFVSRFGRELHAEFGESAKSASGNAQSAVYDLQNSFYELQTGIGEQIAPAATQGISLLSGAVKGLKDMSYELTAATSALSLALGIKLTGSLITLTQRFILTQAVGANFWSAMKFGFQSLINSPTAMWTAGIFAVLEAYHLLNDAVNTDLVQSFQKAADSAKQAADEAEKAFQKSSPNNQSPGENKHISSNSVGQAFDNVIDFLNTDIGPIPGGIGTIKLRRYGDMEYENSIANLDLRGSSQRDLIGSSRLELDQIKSKTGNDGGLIDATNKLNQAEQNRAILEARIQRDYTAQGKNTPTNLRVQLEQQTQLITQLNDKRSDLAKNIDADLANTNTQIGVAKSLLDRLDKPDAAQNFGGQAAVEERRKSVAQELDTLRQTKAQIESTLAALRIDPVLAFSQALRILNLQFSKSTELIKDSLAEGKLANSQKALIGFSTNRFASKDEALANAQIELGAAQQNEAALGKDYFGSRQAVNRPEFQSTLKRLGVSPNSSIAEIEDRLQDKNLPDEDKSLLEKLKSVAELRQQYTEARQSTITARRGLQSSIQENALFNLDEKAVNQKDALQIRENLQEASLKRQQQAKILTEEDVNLELAKIQAKDALNQKQNNEKELADLKRLHDQKIVGAEEYEKRSRELLTEHSNLEKQAAGNDLAVQQAMLQKRIKAYEYANAHAEAVLSTTQASSAAGIKEKELAAGLTQPAKDEAAIQQSKVDEQAIVGRIALLKQEMAQNRDLYKEGLRDSRDFTKEQERLNQELAQANGQLIDNKIQAEENWRAQAEHAIQRVQQAEEGRIKLSESEISQQKANLELYNSSLERTAKLEEARQNLTKAISEEQISSLDNSRNAANQALELAKKLQDDKLDPRLANAIRRQLVASKFLQPRDINADAGSIELAVLGRRNKIEDEIFNKKMAALAAEQSFQEESLKIELQKEKIAAQMAIYDAQSAQLAAAKSRLEAESALRIAKIKGDQDGIKDAEIGLQIADRESALADRRLAGSQENLQIQQELGQDAIGKQRAAQAESLNALNAENDSRKQSEGIERVQTVVDLLTKKGEKSKGDAKFYSQIAIPFTPVAPTEPIDVVEVSSSSDSSTVNQASQSFSTNPMPIDFSPKPGEDIFSAYSKYNSERKPIKIPEIKPGEDSFAAYSRQNAASRQQQPMVSPATKPSDPQQMDGLKNEVKRIGDKLDNLIDKMSNIAGRPSILHVSSPRPVDDAADIYHQMSKSAVQNSGL